MAAWIHHCVGELEGIGEWMDGPGDVGRRRGLAQELSEGRVKMRFSRGSEPPVCMERGQPKEERGAWRKFWNLPSGLLPPLLFPIKEFQEWE